MCGRSEGPEGPALRAATGLHLTLPPRQGPAGKGREVIQVQTWPWPEWKARSPRYQGWGVALPAPPPPCHCTGGPLTPPPPPSSLCRSSFWKPFPGAGLVMTEPALGCPQAGPTTVTPPSQRSRILLSWRPRTYCFMASSLESMLSCFPFISCTSVSSLVTLSWRIFMSSLRRVDTCVPRGAVTEMAWGWGGIQQKGPGDCWDGGAFAGVADGGRAASSKPAWHSRAKPGQRVDAALASGLGGEPRPWGRTLLTLVTFLLMFSRSCSWPRRKHGCWNSVSSLSGLTRPPCSMWTTFRKPSVYSGVRAALPQGWGPTPLSRKAPAPGRTEGGPGAWGLTQGMPSTALPEALPAVAGWS